MRRKLILPIVTFSFLLLTGCTDGSVQRNDSLNTEIEAANNTIAEQNNTISEQKKTITSLEKQLADLQNEFDSYKAEMSEYEGLSTAEAEARKIQAEAEIQAKKEADAAAEATAAAEAEEKEKIGYETGITYEQLARTPDDYTGQLVKFRGKVLQVMESDDEIQIRLAVNDDYDNVIYCGYAPNIVSARVLENDTITIYGSSLGLYSYESTFGGQITIPAVWVDKIEQ